MTSGKCGFVALPGPELARKGVGSGENEYASSPRQTFGMALVKERPSLGESVDDGVRVELEGPECFEADAVGDLQLLLGTVGEYECWSS